MASIYGLLCPDTHICRYVGYTNNVTKRYKQHCRFSENQGNTKRKNWLRKLIEDGKKPEIIILESNVVDWNEAEKRWVKYYRFYSGDLLTNTADGGFSNKHMQESPKSHVKKKKRLKWSTTYMMLTKGDKYYTPNPERVKKIRDTVSMLKKKGLYDRFREIWEERHG